LSSGSSKGSWGKSFFQRDFVNWRFSSISGQASSLWLNRRQPWNKQIEGLSHTFIFGPIILSEETDVTILLFHDIFMSYYISLIQYFNCDAIIKVLKKYLCYEIFILQQGSQTQIDLGDTWDLARLKKNIELIIQSSQKKRKISKYILFLKFEVLVYDTPVLQWNLLSHNKPDNRGVEACVRARSSEHQVVASNRDHLWRHENISS